MKLTQVRLKNFRSYKEETTLRVGTLTAIVGKNNAGKSTFLDALSIFFEECEIDAGDACVHGNKKEVEIACVFEPMSTEVVLDANYPTSLREEFLTNKEGLIEIVKRFKCDLKTPKLVGTYLRAWHPSSDGFSKLHSLKLEGLKAHMEKLGVSKEGVDTKVNAQMRKRLWESADELNLKLQLLPIDSDEAEEAKKIWEHLKKYLPAYALFKSDRASTDQDSEAQNPMRAAIKEALKRQEQKLSEVFADVEKEVMALANETLNKLGEMDSSLAKQLAPKLAAKKWDTLFSLTLTGDDDVPINKHGSGFRRLLLLNFFRANAERKLKESHATSVIYAYEEPETSQHPDNQKLLMRAFFELAEQESCQVLLTTHTPMLGGLLPIDSLRYVSVDDGKLRVVNDDGADTYKRVVKALGVLPDHSVKVFVAVEGINDIEFFSRISRTLNARDESIPDLGKMEADGRLIFIPLGGGNLKVWSSRFENLNRPEFHIYDRELPPQTAEHEAAANEVKKRGNCAAVLTTKRASENYLHPDAIRDGLGVSVAFGDVDDVPAIVTQALNPTLTGKGLKRREGLVKKQLNTLAADKMTDARLDQRDPNGELRGWLKEIGVMAR